MASIHIIPIFSLILLALLPIWSTANDAMPPSSPTTDNVCKDVNCGKGSCKASTNHTFGFACECEAGWKQTRSENDSFFKFLPCVVPNCTVNFSCGEEAPSPAPDKRSDLSIFEPCRWADCGGGSCNKTSLMTYSCVCQEGYYNILNQTGFPCFKECALGMDCAQLGFGLTNTSSSPPPSLPDNSKSIAISIFGGGGYVWLIITAASIAALF